VRLEPERLHASPRQERIKQRLRELIAPRDSVLDLGCGVGATTGFIRSLGVRDLLGVDLAPERIASARRAHPGIEFRVADVPRLDCGRSFDFIVLADLVAHVPAGRRAELFEMLARHSHADTLVWMSLPDPDWLDLREQSSEVAPRMRELLDHAEQSGFRLVSFASFGIEVPFERCEYLWARGAKPARRAAYARGPGLET
jgi:SAM-dependent methyltransferase